MRLVVRGKEEVLDHLEKSTLERTGGKPGEYAIFTDDSGNLVVTIAGLTLIGTGVVSLGGTKMVVFNGAVINAEFAK